MDTLPLVVDFMVTDLLTLRSDLGIYEAVEFLLKHKISGAPVVDEAGKLCGVLSEKDCLKLLASGVSHQRPTGTVADYMTREVVSIPSSMDVYFAAGLFLKNVFRRLPIVDDGKLVGQISRRDVLRAISTRLKDHPRAAQS